MLTPTSSAHVVEARLPFTRNIMIGSNLELPTSVRTVVWRIDDKEVL